MNPPDEEALAGSVVGADFISTLAHELRTPISSLRISFELLRDPRALEGRPADVRRLLDNVERSIGRLERQITDLLEVGYLRAGTLTLHCELVDPHQPIAAALEKTSGHADLRNVTLDLIVDGQLPEIEADPGRLEQVLVHLLSNAIKFTPVGGTVTIHASAVAGGGSVNGTANGTANGVGAPVAEAIQIIVRDHGPGIAREHHEKVFIPFYRVKGGPMEGGAGAGLGLSIAKGLVDLHGGRMWLRSEVGEGAEFGLSLPVHGNHEEGHTP